MPKAFFLKIITLLSLLVFLAAGHGGAHAAVWCFGNDGHLAFKVTPDARCAPADNSSRSLSPQCHDGWEDGDSCSPCLDIPASFGTRTHSGKRIERLQLADAFSASPAPAWRAIATAFTPRTERIRVQPPVPSPHLAHLRTVVLLN